MASAIKSIRTFCVKCMGGSSAQVDVCESRDCDLWNFRFGVTPGTAARRGKEVKVTKAQIKASENAAKIAKERLEKMMADEKHPMAKKKATPKKEEPKKTPAKKTPTKKPAAKKIPKKPAEKPTPRRKFTRGQ